MLVASLGVLSLWTDTPVVYGFRSLVGVRRRVPSSVHVWSVTPTSSSPDVILDWIRDTLTSFGGNNDNMEKQRRQTLLQELQRVILPSSTLTSIPSSTLSSSSVSLEPPSFYSATNIQTLRPQVEKILQELQTLASPPNQVTNVASPLLQQEWKLYVNDCV